VRSVRLAAATLASLVALTLVGCEPIETTSKGKANKPKGSQGTSKTTSRSEGTSKSTSRTEVRITTAKGVCWKGRIGGASKSGCGSAKVRIKAQDGVYRVEIRKSKGEGRLTVVLVVSGDTVDRAHISGTSGIVALSYARG